MTKGPEHLRGGPPQDPVQRLQIAVVTETYPPETNSVARTMRELVEGLRARGHRPQVIRPRQAAEYGHGEVASVPRTLLPDIPIPGYRGLRLGLTAYWRLRGLWGRNRPDLIYIATQGPLGRAALSAARVRGIPTVAGFHTQFERFSHHYGFGILTHHIAATLRQFHHRADATLVPTADLQAALTKAGFTNVHVFGLGVDVDRFTPARRDERLRSAWGCGADDLAVLYVGRIAAENNLDLARDAFAALAARHPGSRFVLVGDGPDLAGLGRDHPEYICTGCKVGDDLAAHYASGDLLLFPSVIEILGRVVPEAMASALPVIAFDCDAAHACIESGVNGVTIHLGDHAGFVTAALDAVADRTRLRIMGEAARRTALDMGSERILSGVESLLLDVMRRRRAGEGRSARVPMASK